MNHFLLVNAAMAVLLILEGLNRKWFAIDEAVLESVPAEKIRRGSKWAMSAGLLILFTVMQLQGAVAFSIGLMVIFTAVAGVKVYFEWKLLKGSRKYRMTLVTYVLGMLFTFFMMHIS
ncbi:hypothetical protein [Planococcus koreensis]|uniref:hypothetical protein n=1 Tax=Planococcus koreensis TaxID=112331 RepID=UPI0039FD8C60